MADDDRIDAGAFRARLLARRTELEQVGETGDDAARPVALDQTRVGRVSRVDALQQQAMAKESQRRREVERQRIEAALQRIEEDAFGWCLRCGESIGARRLDADPTTPICIHCAKARDDNR